MKISECSNRKKEEKTENNTKNKEKKEGYGLIDYIINRLPEIHIPGYQYCGPGTNLEKRLARGDVGINKLDAACKDHDIAYGESTNSKNRYKADKILTARASKRIYSKDANLSERAAALLVTSLMGAKMGLSKIGLGLNSHSKKKNIRKKSKILRAKTIKKRPTKKVVQGLKKIGQRSRNQLHLINWFKV